MLWEVFRNLRGSKNWWRFFEVKKNKTCASCSKNSQIEATETTTISNDYWVNPIIFFVLSKINQYACIIPLPWPYFFSGGGSGIGRYKYGVAWVLGRPIQDTLGSSIYRTKMSKKSSCSSTFQVCVSSTMQKTRGFSDVCPTEWASVWMNRFSKFQVGRRCFWNSGGRCCHLLFEIWVMYPSESLAWIHKIAMFERKCILPNHHFCYLNVRFWGVYL